MLSGSKYNGLRVFEWTSGSILVQVQTLVVSLNCVLGLDYLLSLCPFPPGVGGTSIPFSLPLLGTDFDFVKMKYLVNLLFDLGYLPDDANCSRNTQCTLDKQRVIDKVLYTFFKLTK